MRPREEVLIDPEVAEQLDAIDATLAGEPVSPRFAELAELALLLSAERPEGVRPEFAAELDRRVEGRFARDQRAGGGTPPRRAGSAGGRRRWRLAPMLGGTAAGAALAAGIAVVVLVSAGGGTGGTVNHSLAAAPPPRLSYSNGTATPSTAATTTTAGAVAKTPGAVGGAGTGSGGTSGATGGGVKAAASVPRAPAALPAPSAPGKVLNGSLNAIARSGASSQNVYTLGTGVTVHSSQGAQTFSPAPLPNGRKIVQTSMLELGTPANRIDAVAQEVFDVVRDFNVIVESSNVSSTGGPGASAQFQLRVPSTSLSQALSELSRLRYANVISRTDETQDVNSPYVSAEREITDAKAALVKLRAKLAAASTETEITSLRGRITAENAVIARAQSSLGSLNRRVDYSNVDVTVQAGTSGSSSGGGFGLGKAGHDALRVLEVTAGVALIGLAGLVPLGLLVALAWWLALTVQRRRRDRALDLA